MDNSKYALSFKALADDTRIKIINMLRSGELCACMILENLEITQPTLSYHMKILCDSGLVEGIRDGAWMRYTLKKDKLRSLYEFFESLIIE